MGIHNRVTSFEVPKDVNFILKDVLYSLKSFMQNSVVMVFVFEKPFSEIIA